MDADKYVPLFSSGIGPADSALRATVFLSVARFVF
jgi:hypothetical protein